MYKDCLPFKCPKCGAPIMQIEEGHVIRLGCLECGYVFNEQVKAQPSRPKKRVSFFFAWYDFWVGVYYDRAERVLYVCPLPCCVVRIELGA